MDKSAASTNDKNALPLNVVAKVKKENFDEEIKEYAETAMNELLGWYGYGNNPREEKLAPNCRSNSDSNSSGPDSPTFADGCGWCGKPVEENIGLTAGTNTFCSELCFSQSRRANFKKNKTCDWCRHVRHTVSYVDFQDGASQLQFCSDKCLNQYKMHIFCRETRAHLEMHPHLPVDDSGSGLITPELWMKNCKTPESKSPSPQPSPKAQHQNDTQTSPLPLITVAHPSKLMDLNDGNRNSRIRNRNQRKQRKRCPSTITCSNLKAQLDLPQDLRVRHSPPVNCVENQHPGKEPMNHHADRIPNPYFYHREQPPFPPDPRIPHPAFMNQFQQVPTPLKPAAPPNVLPPVTVLVPYPIMVPVPLPIPIPLPLKSFLQAEQTRKAAETKSTTINCENTSSNNLASQRNGANSSQDNGENIDVVEAEDVAEEKEVAVKNGVVRPLRKRKRIVDPKSRILLKKKSLQT